VPQEKKKIEITNADKDLKKREHSIPGNAR
jgi:hypothetical protein